MSLLCVLVASIALALSTNAQGVRPPTFTPGLTLPTPSTAAGGGAGGGGGNNTGSQAGPSASSTTFSIPSTAEAGGITVTQPVQTADPSYFKIAQGVSATFGWNFTAVLQQPSAITVQAYCSDNGNTYNIGPATGLAGTATSVVWSPYDYSMSAMQNPNLPPLIEATYRLLIYDERGLNAPLAAGRMNPNTKVTFALYNPQGYTPLASGWICASCNGATASLGATHPHPAFLALLTTLVLMLASGWNLLMMRATGEGESERV